MEQQNTYPAGTLPAQGFRFIRSNGLFAWVHPADVPGYLKRGCVDCTDMTDDEFEQAVREVTQ